jgi:hypothetical protein
MREGEREGPQCDGPHVTGRALCTAGNVNAARTYSSVGDSAADIRLGWWDRWYTDRLLEKQHEFSHIRNEWLQLHPICQLRPNRASGRETLPNPPSIQSGDPQSATRLNGEPQSAMLLSRASADWCRWQRDRSASRLLELAQLHATPQYHG